MGSCPAVTRRLVLVIAAIGLALALAGAAFAEQRRIDPADQAVAGGAVLRLADMPNNLVWKADSSRNEPSTNPTCPGYHPKTSDLVDTADASTGFVTSGIAVFDGVGMLETPAMLDHVWQREFEPAFVPCFERAVETGARGLLELVSASRLAVPHLAAHARAYRIVFRPANGTNTRAIVDLVVFGGDRTQVTLAVVATLGDPSQQAAAAAATTRLDVHFAQVIAGRAGLT
jgi:hypothetical protein